MRPSITAGLVVDVRGKLVVVILPKVLVVLSMLEVKVLVEVGGLGRLVVRLIVEMVVLGLLVELREVADKVVVA